mmetsp:Transcript_32632/g.85635  ORF Transcript_32632/g.85635 Transcript_32632/m.85635 type:complete len:233 (+) Transcript_32632:156-854(+)
MCRWWDVTLLGVGTSLIGEPAIGDEDGPRPSRTFAGPPRSGGEPSIAGGGSAGGRRRPSTWGDRFGEPFPFFSRAAGVRAATGELSPASTMACMSFSIRLVGPGLGACAFAAGDPEGGLCAWGVLRAGEGAAEGACLPSPRDRNQGLRSTSSALGRASGFVSSIFRRSWRASSEKLEPCRSTRPLKRPSDTTVPDRRQLVSSWPLLSMNGCWPPCISMLRTAPTAQMSHGRL